MQQDRDEQPSYVSSSVAESTIDSAGSFYEPVDLWVIVELGIFMSPSQHEKTR